jgi:hypothetical protein
VGIAAVKALTLGMPSVDANRMRALHANRTNATHASGRCKGQEQVEEQEQVGTERRSSTTPSSQNALRAAVQKPTKLTPAEKELITEVCYSWARHQGWPAGLWPRDRRYDAVQITEWVRKLGGSIEWWRSIIARVPRGAHFTWLTAAGPSGSSRLEDRAIERRESEWATEKRRHAEDAKGIGNILRRMLQTAAADGTEPATRDEARARR